MDIYDAWQVTGGCAESQAICHSFRCKVALGEMGVSVTDFQILPEPSGCIESHAWPSIS